MSGKAAPLAPQLVAILKAQEMRGERQVNNVRFWFTALSLGMLVTVYPINTYATNVLFTLQLAVWLLYSVALGAWFRRFPDRYVGWLKYLSITVDLGLLTLSAPATVLNHAGVLEYFQGFIPLSFIFWNMLAGFRYSLAAALYSAGLTAAVNGGVLAWAVASGAVAISQVSVYGEAAINIEDQVLAILFVSVPGVVAGLIARTSRRLVLRAEEETMARQRTEQQRDRLRKYLSEDLAELVLENPERLELGGTRMRATIMFTDIRNFTPLSEAREPEEVVAILNGYFTEMVEIVFRWGGTLDKFLGDGLMAVFGVPFEQPDAPERAVVCAMEMQEALGRYNEVLSRDGQPALRIGIGIATGDVVAGNIGSLDRMEYTCIGDAVNYAARLESVNKELGSSIVLDETTAEALGDTLPLRRTPPLRIKGRRGESQPRTLTAEDVEPPVLQAMKAMLAKQARGPRSRPLA